MQVGFFAQGGTVDNLYKMFDWILDNKGWVFSGIGIAIIIIAINIIYRSRDKKQKQIKGITQRYLDILDNKILGYPGIIGLIQSGATQLSKTKHLIKVCEIITQYGKPHPVTERQWNHINEKELLKFIKWQANNTINPSDYFNEKNFARLVQRYRTGISL